VCKPWRTDLGVGGQRWTSKLSGDSRLATE
jgi:hypothetical protein